MEKKKLLEYKDLIYKELPTFENQEIIEHDIQVLQKKLQEQFEANCDLEDYTMKFYHEVKIPHLLSLVSKSLLWGIPFDILLHYLITDQIEASGKFF